MRQFVYKIVVIVIAIILVYEFTIGKKIAQFGGKVDAISSKEGRKETVNKLREEIKKAVKKEFLGGCDIVKEMYENGELKKILKDKNLSFKD